MDEQTQLREMLDGMVAGIMQEAIKQQPKILRAAFVTPYITARDLRLDGLSTIVYPASWMEKIDNCDWNLEDTSVCDLAIIGSTRNSEAIVRNWKGSGLITARYSMFYGGRSGYSNDLAEQTGYCLDLPKNSSAVNALLNHKPTVDAILERDAGKIRKGLEDLNKSQAKPILATPYLEKILN